MHVTIHKANYIPPGLDTSLRRFRKSGDESVSLDDNAPEFLRTAKEVRKPPKSEPKQDAAHRTYVLWGMERIPTTDDNKTRHLLREYKEAWERTCGSSAKGYPKLRESFDRMGKVPEKRPY